MTYLNHAATSHPKPPAVVEAVLHALTAQPASALRSTYGGNEELPTHLRQALAILLHAAHPDSIVITSGGTDSLNRLIGGLGYNHAVATTDNHNSVLRPLYNLKGIQQVDIVESDIIDHPHLWPAKMGGQAMLILPHCSNVTGTIHDIPRICIEAHRRGMAVVVDAAQSAGCIPIDADGWEVDAIAFTGHKALFGPPGTGGYYLRPGIALRPTLFGGTGRDSSIIEYKSNDWEYEVGTPNLPGMAGLKAGVELVLKTSVEHIFQQVQAKTLWLIQELTHIDHVAVYSQGGESQGPVVSFNIKGLSPSDVGYLLENAYGITTRTGLHCASLIHRQLGTTPYGTVRASLSHQTTDGELQALVAAIREISQGL